MLLTRNKERIEKLKEKCNYVSRTISAPADFNEFCVTSLQFEYDVTGVIFSLIDRISMLKHRYNISNSSLDKKNELIHFDSIIKSVDADFVGWRATLTVVSNSNFELPAISDPVDIKFPHKLLTKEAKLEAGQSVEIKSQNKDTLQIRFGEEGSEITNIPIHWLYFASPDKTIHDLIERYQVLFLCSWNECCSILKRHIKRLIAANLMTAEDGGKKASAEEMRKLINALRDSQGADSPALTLYSTIGTIQEIKNIYHSYQNFVRGYKKFGKEMLANKPRAIKIFNKFDEFRGHLTNNRPFKCMETKVTIESIETREEIIQLPSSDTNRAAALDTSNPIATVIVDTSLPQAAGTTLMDSMSIREETKIIKKKQKKNKKKENSNDLKNEMNISPSENKTNSILAEIETERNAGNSDGVEIGGFLLDNVNVTDASVSVLEINGLGYLPPRLENSGDQRLVLSVDDSSKVVKQKVENKIEAAISDHVYSLAVHAKDEKALEVMTPTNSIVLKPKLESREDCLDGESSVDVVDNFNDNNREVLPSDFLSANNLVFKPKITPDPKTDHLDRELLLDAVSNVEDLGENKPNILSASNVSTSHVVMKEKPKPKPKPDSKLDTANLEISIQEISPLALIESNTDAETLPASNISTNNLVLKSGPKPHSKVDILSQDGTVHASSAFENPSEKSPQVVSLVRPKSGSKETSRPSDGSPNQRQQIEPVEHSDVIVKTQIKDNSSDAVNVQVRGARIEDPVLDSQVETSFRDEAGNGLYSYKKFSIRRIPKDNERQTDSEDSHICSAGVTGSTPDPHQDERLRTEIQNASFSTYTEAKIINNGQTISDTKIETVSADEAAYLKLEGSRRNEILNMEKTEINFKRTEEAKANLNVGKLHGNEAVAEIVEEFSGVGTEEGSNSTVDGVTTSQLQKVEAEQLTSMSVEVQQKFIIKGVIHPRTGREISFDEAIFYNIIDPQRGLYINRITNISKPIAQAMNEGLIKVETVTQTQTQEKKEELGMVTIKSKMVATQKSFKIVGVKDPVSGKSLSVDEATSKGLLQLDRFKFANQDLNIEEAEKKGFLKVDWYEGEEDEGGREEFESRSYLIRSVVDQKLKRPVLFQEAINTGLIDPATGIYTNNATGEEVELDEAVKRGLVKGNLVEGSNQLADLVDPTRRIVVEERINKVRKLVTGVNAFRSARKNSEKL